MKVYFLSPGVCVLTLAPGAILNVVIPQVERESFVGGRDDNSVLAQTCHTPGVLMTYQPVGVAGLI